MKKFAIFFATFFNVGKFPGAPGTLASGVTMVVVFIFNYFFQPDPLIMISAIIIIFLAGIKPSGITEEHYGHKDPHEIVIDEVAGQMVSLLFLPAVLSTKSIAAYIAGFFIFRFFDILKPFPVRQADRIKGGFGIMIDDILAGLYSLGTIHLLIYIYRSII